MIISPAELVYFIEIAACLNISKAAIHLGISQPSLSLAMQRLEKSLNTTLLIREKRGVQLTPAGKQLLLHAKQLLEQWEIVQCKAFAANNEMIGDVTIGCHTSIALNILNTLLPSLINDNPKLRIHLKHENSILIIEKVINLELDLGIVVNLMSHPDLVIHKLYTDITTFWYSTIAAPIKNIRDIERLFYDAGSLQTQNLLKKINKQQLKNVQLVTSNSLEVIATLTASSKGACILPTCVAQTIEPSGLKPIQNAPRCRDEICLIYRPEKKSLKFIDVITKAIKGLI